MKLLNILFFGVLLIACGVETNPHFEDHETEEVQKPREVWICHNPTSDSHGEICDDEKEPGDCLVSGDTSKFCWLLDVRECELDHNLPYNKFCN